MKLQKLITTTVIFGMTLSSVPSINLPASAKTVNVTVPKAAVAIAFNTALSSIKVHLDNYGPKHRNSSAEGWEDGVSAS